MNCGKVALFILMPVVLVLSGCVQGFRNGVTQKAQDDTVCIKRADLKLIAAALNIDTATLEAMVLLLLAKGANVNAPSNLMVKGKKAGFTPLMIAKGKGHQEIVKLLTEAG